MHTINNVQMDLATKLFCNEAMQWIFLGNMHIYAIKNLKNAEVREISRYIHIYNYNCSDVYVENNNTHLYIRMVGPSM